MNPLLDHILTTVLVLGALAYFVRRFLPRRSGKSCDAGYGCSATKPATRLPK